MACFLQICLFIYFFDFNDSKLILYLYKIFATLQICNCFLILYLFIGVRAVRLDCFGIKRHDIFENIANRAINNFLKFVIIDKIDL